MAAVEAPLLKNNVASLNKPSSPISPEASKTVPRTIDELMRSRAQTSPNQKILGYPDSSGKYIEYTYRQLDVFAFHAAQKYAQLIAQRRKSEEKERVVGLLGLANLDYLITVLALSKLGFTVLFLSTRIANIAYESLLRATSATHLLIHPAFASKARAIKADFPDLPLTVTYVLEQAEYETVSPQFPGETRLDHAFDLSVEAQKIAWIIHSSGSTGLPKPILQTHQAALQNYATNMNMRGFIMLPLFHAHGLSSVFRAFSSMKEIHMHNADLPLTSKNLLETLQENNFEIFYSVPYALKLLGETVTGIRALAKLKIVMFGGSACPDALGDRLVENGVNLVSHYGTTETGQLMTSFRPPGDKAWNCVRPSQALKPFLRWETMGENIFELVVLPGWPSLVTSNRPDGAYATKDLFSPHPTIPDAWKYFARSDDTIVLLNGEKAVPIDMEMAVRQIGVVQEAVVFGSGKSQLGLMVVPLGVSEGDMMTEIWPVVQKVNVASPAYAQISSEMIKCLPAGTKYPSTDKGTVIRQAFYKTFASEIASSYASRNSILDQPPSSDAEIRQFLRQNVTELLTDVPSENIQNSTDFFSLGMDSLQSTRLRGSILKKLPIPETSLGINIVFEFPSIDALTLELSQLQKGDGPSQTGSVEEQMRDLIERYDEFPAHISQDNSENGEYLVVTGATGSLGAHLVAKLAAQPNVKQITCFVRAKSAGDAYIRVVSSMRQRAVYHQMTLNSLQKIVAIPADFSKPNLGLKDDTYNGIAQNITSLIHCAWSVNFNLKLSSFEKDCIAGARHLILLCLAARRPCPAKFTFCSSVSAVAATPGDQIPEALPQSLSYAQNMGYAQSKLVTENLVTRAASKTGMVARVVRVGQIIGDAVHGIWNATEAIPMMLQAGITIGAIPALDEYVRWLPVDTVAQSLLEISSSDETPPPNSVINLVAPSTMHWTRDLLPKLHDAGMEFEELDQKQWISKLRNSEQDPVKNPPIKLLEFFAQKYDNDHVVRKSMEYATDLARVYSPALAAAKPADQQLINKIISHFLATSWKLPANTTEACKLGKVIIVSGPCGSGKSTIATAINSKLRCPYIEGDDYHDASSLAKMSSGIPLSDSDRWAWLERLKDISKQAVAVAPSHTVLMTCSALKSVYRDRLRYSPTRLPLGKDGGRDGEIEIETTFVLLQVTEDEARRRVGSRSGHYMGVKMVDEQMKLLELPGVKEVDVLSVDAGKSPQEIAEDLIRLLKL